MNEAGRLRHAGLQGSLLELGVLALLLPPILLMRPAWSPLLLTLPLLWLLRWRRDGRLIPPTLFDPALLLLLLMVLVTVLITPDLPFSLPKVAGLLYGITLFYAVVAAVERRPSLLWMGTIALGVSGFGVVALGVTAGRDIGPLSTLINNLPGTPSVGVNLNEVAGIITWLLPWLAALAVTGVRRRVWLVALPTAVASVILAAVLWLTGSRGALLGVGVALLLLAAITLRHRRRLVVAGTGLLLLAALIGVWVVGPTAVVEAVAGSGSPDGIARTLRGRAELWSRAVYVIQDFPLTGVGLNNFRRVVPLLYPLFLTPPAVDFGHAHNQLLHVGAELGVPGLVAFVTLWGSAGLVLVRAWRRAPSPWVRSLAAGFGLSLVAFFIFGLTDALALGARPGFLWWLLLALSVALERTPPNSSFPTADASHR